MFEAVKKFKSLGIVVSILLILIGLCLFLRPVKSDAFLIYLVVFGLLINGIEKIFVYFKMEKNNRDGWLFVSGILWVITSVILLSSMLSTVATMASIAGICMGISGIFNGVAELCKSKYANELRSSKGMMILSGICAIICGTIMLSAPIFTTIMITIFYGAHIFILGISLLISCLSIKVEK